ncbi:hypothetical protein Q9233_016134 [Columba guinea]|nr:hypothetical protein Q9233_016134 [Columba guinea]
MARGFDCKSPISRSQLALWTEPPGQQGDKNTLQDSEEERGVSSRIILQQPRSQLEDEASGDIQPVKHEDVSATWMLFIVRIMVLYHDMMLPKTVILLIHEPVS